MVNPMISKVMEVVNSKPVAIFMKGNPDFPQCGFSARACEVLKMVGVAEFTWFDVLSDDAVWEALEQHTQWPTVPQVFIHGQFVGGCDLVAEMYESGELRKLLEKRQDKAT